METSLLPLTVGCILTFICSFITFALIYFCFNSPFTYWKKLGVVQDEVENFIFGDLRKYYWLPKTKLLEKVYYGYPNERYVGIYTGTSFRNPALLLRDPELVEAVLVRDFSFLSSRGFIDTPDGSRLRKHLLNLGGEHWKVMRNKLNPTFSSSKLKGMHPQLEDCADSLIRYMESLEHGRPFEVKDVVTRFTIDVIASCAFGLNLDTINEPHNEFRRMANIIFTPTPKMKFMMFLRGAAPWLLKLIQLFRRNTPKDNFFVKTLEGTIKYRQENNIIRPDFLHLTNELKLKDLEMIKNNEMDPNYPYVFDHASLLSNAFVFFVGGFETTATTISNTMYELAVNTEVQDKLYQEVTEVLSKNDGQLSYSALMEMVYLEQVISETLRKYPPLPSLRRKVVKEYKIPGSDLILPEGSVVEIPVHMFHHDPQYFPDPEKFQPERFASGKEAIRKGTYIPFGGGPRVCIGERFAKLEAKMCMAKMVKKFEIVKCDKTKVPLEFDHNAILLAPKGGIWVAIRLRPVN